MSLRRSTEWSLGVGLVASSVLLSLLLGEAALRLVFPAGDFLMPVLARNDVLGMRIRPGARGFDKWGFRNPAVPGHVDIVAVGDSFTYGYSARRADAWPAKLAQISHLSVYNLGMGGWGPQQYDCALRIFGLRLNPKVAVVGLYMGNDLQDAATAGPIFIQCESLSPESLNQLDRETLLASHDHRILGATREWLAQHSVLYQALKFSLPRLKGLLSSRLVVADDYTSREIKGNTVVLRKGSWLASNPDVASVGLVKLVEALKRIKQLCGDHHLGCVIVLIPSREAIYAELVPDLRGLKKEMDVDMAIAEELKSALGRGLVFVEPLSALQQAVVDGKQIFPNSEDIHLNAVGHEVLAKEIAKGLEALPRPDERQ